MTVRIISGIDLRLRGYFSSAAVDVAGPSPMISRTASSSFAVPMHLLAEVRDEAAGRHRRGMLAKTRGVARYRQNRFVVLMVSSIADRVSRFALISAVSDASRSCSRRASRTERMRGRRMRQMLHNATAA
jgi:hypothetical protein